MPRRRRNEPFMHGQHHSSRSDKCINRTRAKSSLAFLSARLGRQNLAFVVAAIMIAGLISVSLFLTIGRAPSSQTTTGIITSTGSTMTTIVDGAPYYADNVTDMIVNSNSFHFNNGSVTFRGVNFQTICTTYAGGCPGVPAPPPGVTIAYPSGSGIAINVTFADHSSETVSGAFPLDPVHFHAFTLHTNPQAGILIVYTDSNPGFKSYLLVSTSISSTSGGAGISSNTAVATVTMTATLTTQASQATTTYAIPTSDCTPLGGEIVILTTITVGPTPPASTTTTTVTTTSSTYTQTVTVTSCIGSGSTVTSTVTTTANP
jgi:hypothetical protein